MWKLEEEDRRRRPKIVDPRTLPPCMGGYVERPIKPMPGTAEYKKMEQEIALAKEEEEKKQQKKRIEKLEEKLENFEALEEKLDKIAEKVKHYGQHQLSRDDIRRLCSYEEIGEYSEGLAVVRDKDGKYGYIDENNKEVIKCKYDEAHVFKNGIAKVRENGYCGYINKKEENVISCKYDEIFDFKDGLAVVKKDGYYGYINEKGENVISCKYDEASYFNEYGKACVKKDGKIYIINNNGEIIDLKLHVKGDADKYLHRHEFDSSLKISDFVYGVAVIKNPDKSYTYVDEHYRPISDNFDVAFPFSNGGHHVIIKKDGIYSYGNLEWKNCGYEVISNGCSYEAVSDFVDGIACVKIAGKLFFINNGYRIIEWDFHGENKNLENSIDEVMYNPVFVTNDEYKGRFWASPLTFFRKKRKIVFIDDNGIIENHEVEYIGFKVIKNIDDDALTYPWSFCNGIPFYKKDGYIFVIDVDFEHEDKKNKHDGLVLIRYIRRLFGYRYFQMLFENNEIKMMAFETLKIESEEDLKEDKIEEKIEIFIKSAKEYLIKKGEWKKFSETINVNIQILNNNNKCMYETLVDDIQSDNDNNSENDKQVIIQYDEIYDEIIRIAKEQKKIFDALNRLIEKAKLLGNNPEIANIIKDIFQTDMQGDVTTGIQYTKKKT